MNKNMNYQKYQVNVFSRDVEISKVVKNCDNSYVSLNDKNLDEIVENEVDFNKKRKEKKIYYRTLNLLLNDINSIKVKEDEFDLKLYEVSKILTNFSYKLYLIDYWTELISKNVLVNGRNVSNFKKWFNKDYISYVSLLVSLINNRNISLHITMDSSYLNFNILQLVNINIKELIQKTLKYEEGYGVTTLTLNDKVNYNFDTDNKIQFFISNNDIIDLLLPIDNCLILKVLEQKIICFCLQYNFFLKTRIYQEVNFIAEGEHNEKNNNLTEVDYALDKMIDNDDDIRDVFLHLNDSETSIESEN